MYLAGVSVRRVEDITQALWGTRVSASTVSDLNQKIYKQIEEWRQQPLVGDFPYVFLDGLWLKRSWGGEVKNLQSAKDTALDSFARGLLRDQDAVLAALKLPWSNGPVEGNVHRLKLIKRQMYGRASFDLLRIRVLNAA